MENTKHYIEMPKWIQKEIELYNSRGPVMKAITRMSLAYLAILLLSHVTIIVR